MEQNRKITGRRRAALVLLIAGVLLLCLDFPRRTDIAYPDYVFAEHYGPDTQRMILEDVVGTHLTVEIILHEAPETGDFLISLGQRIGPVVEHGSSIEVTIVTELCIRYQPLLILSVEILIVSSSAQRCPFLVK